jgi:hypothetical protein
MEAEILRGIDERLAVLDGLVVQLAASVWEPETLRDLADDCTKAAHARTVAISFPGIMPPRALNHRAKLLQDATDLAIALRNQLL